MVGQRERSTRNGDGAHADETVKRPLPARKNTATRRHIGQAATTCLSHTIEWIVEWPRKYPSTRQAVRTAQLLTLSWPSLAVAPMPWHHRSAQ